MSHRVIRAVSADAQRWDEYVNRASNAALYHLYDWRRVIEETFGHQTVYLAAERGSRIAGVLPLVQLKSWAFGNMLVSMPFFNYGGISADHPEVQDDLMDAAIEVARERGSDFVEIRHDDDVWERDLPRKTNKVSMRLQLPQSADALWKSFPAKLRNQVQRPRKEGMTVAVGREEELAGFYDVFSANMRDLGTPVYPRAFFSNILRTFPDRTWIVTVRSGETTVAAGFLAGFKDRLEIPWASSARAFNRFSPNMLLYWKALEFACERGYGVFDFGRSTPGEGTHRFKAQWGATSHPLYWYYWLRNGGDLPQVNPTNPKYKMAIALWQRLPLGLTRQLGPSIVKYIP
jgi:FemAB-related protein (PEP-CTERM system-associated)